VASVRERSHHSPTTETEMSKTLDLCSELTRFVARGDFIFTYSGTFSFYIRGRNVVVQWLTLKSRPEDRLS
jgi:hypothetical protein